jgi:hypothetical protein
MFAGIAYFLKNYVQVYKVMTQNGGFRQLQNDLFISQIRTHVIALLLARNSGTLVLHANVARQELNKTQLNSVFV